MLVVVEHPDHPPAFYKDTAPNDAKIDWLNGFSLQAERTVAPRTTARQITLDEFLQLCPLGGFCVVEDSGS